MNYSKPPYVPIPGVRTMRGGEQEQADGQEGLGFGIGLEKDSIIQERGTRGSASGGGRSGKIGGIIPSTPTPSEANAAAGRSRPLVTGGTPLPDPLAKRYLPPPSARPSISRGPPSTCSFDVGRDDEWDGGWASPIKDVGQRARGTTAAPSVGLLRGGSGTTLGFGDADTNDGGVGQARVAALMKDAHDRRAQTCGLACSMSSMLMAQQQQHQRDRNRDIAAKNFASATRPASSLNFKDIFGTIAHASSLGLAASTAAYVPETTASAKRNGGTKYINPIDAAATLQNHYSSRQTLQNNQQTKNELDSLDGGGDESLSPSQTTKGSRSLVKNKLADVELSLKGKADLMCLMLGRSAAHYTLASDIRPSLILNS